MKLLEWYFDRFHKRTFIYKLEERFKDKPLIGVEIGTRFGYNAKHILKNLNIKKLYLIDPYIPNTPGFRKHSYFIAKNRLRKYEDKIKFILNYSYHSYMLVPNNLDFVYIDGNHQYEYVLRDITIYYKKLHCNGVLCGHDFDSKGVSRAVVEFALEHDLTYMTSYCLPRVDWFYEFNSAKKSK